jgi:hypothetical protein
MKQIVVILTFLVVLTGKSSGQNIGINSTGATPETSAMLDVSATNKGMLIPRVALTAKNLSSPISSPVLSLLVYNTATAGAAPNVVVPGFYYWNGTSWTSLNPGNNQWALDGNSGTVAESNFIGTTDSVDFVVKTNNQSRFFISADGNVGIGTNEFDGEKLLVDGGGDASEIDPLTMFYGYGETNNYVELNIQNNSNGNMASTDIVATANNGTGSSVYVDLGINSQGYFHNASNILNGPNLGYLYSNADDFKIGNGTPGKNLIFFTNRVNGPASTVTANGNERMRITAAGYVGINTATPLSTVDVAGSVGTSIVLTSANLTLDETNYTVIISSGSTPTITLPTASATNARRIYVIVNQTSAARTISSYKNFSNAAATTIAATSSITLQSDGTNWYRIH